MREIHVKYILDEHNRPIAAQIPIEEFRVIEELLENNELAQMIENVKDLPHLSKEEALKEYSLWKSKIFRTIDHPGIFWPNYYEALKRMFRRGTCQVTWSRKGSLLSYRIDGDPNEKFRLLLAIQIKEEDGDAQLIIENKLMPDFREPFPLCQIPEKEGLWAFEVSWKYDSYIRGSNSCCVGQAEITFIPTDRGPRKIKPLTF